MYAGTLNKITYPTGGVTEFTYEPHSYSKQLSLHRTLEVLGRSNLAGGLRIKKISSYDPASPLSRREKNYYYVNGFTSPDKVTGLLSSGILGGQSQYYYLDYRRKIYAPASGKVSQSIFSSQSVLPGSENVEGSHIGYTEVVEMSNDGSFNKYKFSNFDTGQTDEPADGTMDQSRAQYQPYSSNSQSRGRLTEEECYSAEGTKLKERVIYYTALNKGSEYARSVKKTVERACPNNELAVGEGTAYRIYTYSYVPSHETTTEYDINGEKLYSRTKLYSYDPLTRLLSEESSRDSKGRDIKVQYIRPNNLNQNQIYSQMAGVRHILSPIIEERRYLNGSQTSAVFTDYDYVSNLTYLPVKVRRQTLPSAPIVDIMSYSYDSQGNISCEYKNGTGLATPIYGAMVDNIRLLL